MADVARLFTRMPHRASRREAQIGPILSVARRLDILRLSP
jgi:hypothetical protein